MCANKFGIRMYSLFMVIRNKDNFLKFIRKQNFNLNMLLNHSLRDPILCIHNKSNLVPSPLRVHLPQWLPPGAQGPYIPTGGRELWSHQGVPDVVEPKET